MHHFLASTCIASHPPLVTFFFGMALPWQDGASGVRYAGAWG